MTIDRQPHRWLARALAGRWPWRFVSLLRPMKVVVLTSSLLAEAGTHGLAQAEAATGQSDGVGRPGMSASAGPVRTSEVDRLREDVPPPIFPNPTAPAFTFPAPTPQSHGLDLTVHDRATAEKYFAWLCENDAGAWTHRVVDDVEGVFAMRHRPSYMGSASLEVRLRFFIEDPWGSTSNGNVLSTDAGLAELRTYSAESEWLMPGKLSMWYGPPGFHVYLPMLGYEYFERPVLDRERQSGKFSEFVRFERFIPPGTALTSDDRDITDFGFGNGRSRTENRFRQPGEVWLWVPLIHRQKILQPQPKAIDALRSRYGFFWRGIQRSSQDRYLNIGGGEEYVVDLSDNSVLAFRRGFVLADGKPGAGQPIDWSRRKSCSRTQYPWIQYVLRPADGLARRGIDVKRHPTPDEVPGEAGPKDR